MNEAQRFLRYITPGLVFLAEALFLLVIILPEWTIASLAAIKGDQALGLILGTLLASGGLGFIFSVIHHASHWAWGEPPVDHSGLVARLRKRRVIMLLDAQTDTPIPHNVRVDRADAWVIVTALWHERLGTSEHIKGAEPRARALADMIHTTGTARVASATAWFVALAIAAQVAQPSLALGPALRFVLVNALGFLLLCIHNWNCRRVAFLAQGVIEEVLDDALVAEKNKPVRTSTLLSGSNVHEGRRCSRSINETEYVPFKYRPKLIRFRQLLDWVSDFASHTFSLLSLVVLFAVILALSKTSLPWHLVLVLFGLKLFLWVARHDYLLSLKNELSHILQRWPMPRPYVPSALRLTLARLNQECTMWEYKPLGKWTAYLDCSTKKDYFVSFASPFRKGRAVFLSARLLDEVGQEMALIMLDFVLSRKYDPRLGPTAFVLLVSVLVGAYYSQSTWMLLLVPLTTRLLACALREEILAADHRIATRISFAKWRQFAETTSNLTSVMGIFANAGTLGKVARVLFCWPISLSLPDRIELVRPKST